MRSRKFLSLHWVLNGLCSPSLLFPRTQQVLSLILAKLLSGTQAGPEIWELVEGRKHPC